MSDVNLAQVKRKPFDAVLSIKEHRAKRLVLDKSRRDSQQFKPLLGIFIDAFLAADPHVPNFKRLAVSEPAFVARVAV